MAFDFNAFKVALTGGVARKDAEIAQLKQQIAENAANSAAAAETADKTINDLRSQVESFGKKPVGASSDDLKNLAIELGLIAEEMNPNPMANLIAEIVAADPNIPTPAIVEADTTIGTSETTQASVTVAAVDALVEALAE